MALCVTNGEKDFGCHTFKKTSDLTINSDCTGEPPGELMLRKTASNFLGVKALSISFSNESILRGWPPNLQGVPLKLGFSFFPLSSQTEFVFMQKIK